MASQLRTRALRLYRAAMRSARKCPSRQHAAEVASYVRLKYAETTAPRSLAANLDTGEEEVARLEHYHEIRLSKATGVTPPSYEEVLERLRQSLRAPSAPASPLPLRVADSNHSVATPRVQAPQTGICAASSDFGPSDSGPPPQNLHTRPHRAAKFCSSCGTRFSELDKFCSECGVSRRIDR